MLRGNLAPEGAVAKITGVKSPRITGPARVFESEEACLEAILAGQIRPGDVVVIRYEGPRGGPGHAGDAGAHLGASSARGWATRSGSSPTGGSRAGPTGWWWATSRRRPRSADRSPWSRRATRSPSTPSAGCSQSMSPEQELARRRAAWTPPAPRYTAGVLYKYARQVSSASLGAVTDL